METLQTISPPAGYIVDPTSRMYRWMITRAQWHWENGHSQIAADTLAFVLAQATLPGALRDQAESLIAELESRICPRVILDAREFAADMDLRAMIEYLLDVD